MSAAGGWVVNLEPGACIVGGGHWGRNFTQKQFTIDPPSGALPRIDSFVLRHESTGTRDIHEVIVKGMPSSMPVAKPLQRDADAYEICVAQIYVAANATYITQASITDTRRDSDLCGIISSLLTVNADTLFAQYEAIFKEFMEDLAEWRGREQEKHASWFAEVSQMHYALLELFTNLDGDARAQYDQLVLKMDAFYQQAQAEFYAWYHEQREVLDGDVAGNLLNRWGELDDRLKLVESSVFNDIKENSFLVLFDDLGGVAAEGVWNPGLRRIEC